MIKVAAYTGGLDVPSARYRVRQLIPALQRNHIQIKEYRSPISVYPPKQKLLRPFWGAGVLLSRSASVVAGYQADVTLLQREMLSTLVSLEPFTKSPRVLDVDDAIFLFREGRAAKKLAELSEHVICGNEFLAEKFNQWNKQMSIVPTAVDTTKYVPKKLVTEKKIIGWMGTSGNFSYLYKIAPALEKILTSRSDGVFRIVSDQRPEFNSKLDQFVDYIKWTPANEVEQLQSMTVGLMPLEDGEWERGKCSFKMLQYMACGVPTVVSPVGMNRQVLALGDSGFFANTETEWVDRISDFLDNEKLRTEFGSKGREVVEQHFSHEIIATKLTDVLKKVI